MSEILHHALRAKQIIKNSLLQLLYNHFMRAHVEEINRIISANTQLQKCSHNSFHYKGHTYSYSAVPIKTSPNKLHESLYARMEHALNELTKINREELPYVTGFINKVLNSTDHFCDFLQIFPEAIHEPIKILADICPCKTAQLSADKIEKIKTDHAKVIDLIIQRQVTNMIT